MSLVGTPELVLGGLLFAYCLPGVMVAWQVWAILKRLPQEHRLMGAAWVWPLAIPCFSLLWNFVALPKVSSSLQTHFREQAKQGVGDCGKQSGLAYSVVSVGILLPGKFGVLAWAASLGLLIGHLHTLRRLSFQVVSDEAATLVGGAE